MFQENGINLDGSVREGYGVQSSAQCSLCSAALTDNDSGTKNFVMIYSFKKYN